MTTYNCLQCNKECELHPHHKANKYCSIKCQHDFQYATRLEEWKKTGIVTTINCPTFLRRHVFEEQGGKCAKCGIADWQGKSIVLELEHKNGNGDDHSRDNIELLCPNCHSQTPTYKGANRGKGRHSRKERYKAGKSF
jgi:5-methylcytosine-specific restriction endonuclease McrA